jgi:hypothetical protein
MLRGTSLPRYKELGAVTTCSTSKTLTLWVGITGTIGIGRYPRITTPEIIFTTDSIYSEYPDKERLTLFITWFLTSFVGISSSKGIKFKTRTVGLPTATTTTLYLISIANHTDSELGKA